MSAPLSSSYQAAAPPSARPLHPTMCCKCVDVATCSCVDCDLLYCLPCSDQRHSKGSFQRHVVTKIPVSSLGQQPNQTRRAVTCDECVQDCAVLHCSACELAYCDPCSKDIHRSGSLQHHSRDSFNYLPLSSPTKTTSSSTLSSHISPDLLGQPRKSSDSFEAMWGGGAWSSSFDRPTSASSAGEGASPTFRSSFSYESWMNPAHDTMSSSSSSDEDAKANGVDGSIKTAFSTLSLAQPSPTTDTASFHELFSWRHPTSDDESRRRRRHEAALLSQNQLEDLFSALESAKATRHVLVRSTARHMTQCQVATIQRIMHTFGDVAYGEDVFAPHGVLLFAYFDMRAAAIAVQRAAALLDDDDLSIEFSVPMPPSSSCGVPPHASGVVIVAVEVNNEPLPSLSEVHAFCAQFATVAAVAQLDNSAGTFTVEFTDSRDAVDAVVSLNDASFGGKFAVSAKFAPDQSSHVIELFQAAATAAKAATERSDTNQYKLTNNFASIDVWTTTSPAVTVDPSVKQPLLAEPAAGRAIPVPNTHGTYGHQTYTAYQGSYDAAPRATHAPPVFRPHYPTTAPPLSSYQYSPPFSTSPPGPPTPPVVASEYSLGIDRVHKGEDARTTLMIRNIPNKYTQAMLLAEINHHGHHGDYDFFYLPIDFKNKCNMGYAFINFMTTDAIVPFYSAFNGQRWRNFNSEKVCAISYARLQGKAAMINRFQNSSLLDKHESYRPLVFKSFGPDKGAREPFPAPRASFKHRPANENATSPPPLPAPQSSSYYPFCLLPPPQDYRPHAMFPGPPYGGRMDCYHQPQQAFHGRHAASQSFHHGSGHEGETKATGSGSRGYLDAKKTPSSLPALHA